MLCEDKCDAGGPNQPHENIGNLGLWTEPGIPTKATRLETHQAVRFFVVFLCSFDFCPDSNFIAGRTVFILTNGCNSNLNPPHTPKTPIKQRVLFTYHLFLPRFYDKISPDTGDCTGRYNHPKYACMELDGEQHDQTETNSQQNNNPAQDIVGILF